MLSKISSTLTPPSSVYIKTCAGGGGLYCKSVLMNNRSKPGFCLKPLNHEKLWPFNL